MTQSEAGHSFYIANLQVFRNARTFEKIGIGDLFTDADVIGFGNIWLGFKVYMKTSDGRGVCLEYGDGKNFRPTDAIRIVRWRGIERPERTTS